MPVDVGGYMGTLSLYGLDRGRGGLTIDGVINVVASILDCESDRTSSNLV